MKQKRKQKKGKLLHLVEQRTIPRLPLAAEEKGPVNIGLAYYREKDTLEVRFREGIPRCTETDKEDKRILSVFDDNHGLLGYDLADFTPLMNEYFFGLPLSLGIKGKPILGFLIDCDGHDFLYIRRNKTKGVESVDTPLTPFADAKADAKGKIVEYQIDFQMLHPNAGIVLPFD